MKITGFLSKKGNKWSRTSKPITMSDDGQLYIIALLEDIINTKDKLIQQSKPQYIKGTKSQLLKVAIGYMVE